MKPETHRFAVYVDHFAHVSAKQVEVLHVLIDIAFFFDDAIAVFLREDVLDAPGRVDEAHH